MTWKKPQIISEVYPDSFYCRFFRVLLCFVLVCVYLKQVSTCSFFGGCNLKRPQLYSRWWFQIFFMFTHLLGFHDPIWRRFFKWLGEFNPPTGDLLWNDLNVSVPPRQWRLCMCRSADEISYSSTLAALSPRQWQHLCGMGFNGGWR